MDTRKITQFFKGIAIFFVILCHSHQTFSLPYSLNNVFSFLQIGVQLFMLLSAMGLCFSYSQKPLGWWDFMKKRLSKIVTSYWFAIVIAAFYRILFAFVEHRDVLQELNPLGIIVNALLLHGFSPDGVINNGIVRGGWFVGAIVILYAIFPVLYRLYFAKNKKWEKFRIYLFPLLVFAVTSIATALLNLFKAPFTLNGILTHLACFCMGFPLFDLQKSNTFDKVKLPMLKAIVFTLISIALYFTNTNITRFYVFAITLAFFYYFIFALKRKKSPSTSTKKHAILQAFDVLGKYSFPIYLTHSYVAFDFCYILTAILSKIYVNDLLWFILLQPLVIFLSYIVSKLFDIILDFLVSKITSKKQKNS